MLRGRFAQAMEAVSLTLIVAGIVALCQAHYQALFHHGLGILVTGWLGFSVFSHRRPALAEGAGGNPQTTIDGRPPADVTLRIEPPVVGELQEAAEPDAGSVTPG